MSIIQSDESEWTKANIQKLLAALKTGIEEHERFAVYTKGLKAVDWNKVAFPPFSPEACQEKWTEILHKMPKIRTLTEIIVEAEDVISNPVKKSRCNKILPDFPKRPCPPNAIFYEEKCVKYREKHPQMKSQKMLRVLNKKYQKLPDEQKAQYEEKHQLATEEYQRKMQAFRKKNHMCPLTKSSPKPKRRRVSEGVSDKQGEEPSEYEDGLPHKPPFNGYNLFCKEQLTSTPGDPRKNFVQMSAQRWRDLTASQRDEYSKRCIELKEEYSCKLLEYLRILDVEEQDRILKKHGIKRPKEFRRETKHVKTFPGEPKMPSQSGNVIFFKDQMELLKGGSTNSKDRFSKINQMWKDLSQKEKDRYTEKARGKVRKYSKELQQWFKKLTPAEQQDYLLHNTTKGRFLNAKEIEVEGRSRNDSYRPSDSEDENMESSSSEEEEENMNSREGEEYEGDGGDDIMFEMF